MQDFGEQDFISLLDAFPAAVSCIAADGRYIFANRTYRTWFGAEGVRGKRMAEVLPPSLYAEAARHVPDVMKGKTVCFTVPEPTLTNPGAVLRVRYTPASRPNVDRWFALIEDVSPCIHEQERLRRLSETDPLTGVLNRRGFMQLAEASLAVGSAALLIIDIDGFKQVNDSHGHPFGDEVLKGVAAACARTVREGDLVGRLGGEEFGILLPGASLNAAAEVAERVRRTVHDLAFDGTHAPTVSVGVAEARAQALDALLKAADVELYRAKRGGRNRICLARCA